MLHGRTRLSAGLVALVCLFTASWVLGEAVETAAQEAEVPELRAVSQEAAEEAKVGRGMSLWQVVVVGVIEGATEYLPVSSTGHILLVQRAIGIEQTEAADAFAVVIQGGAILAILGLYFRRTKKMTLGLVGRDPEGLKLAINVILAFLPFAVVALLFYSQIKDLFGLWESVIGWIAGGVVILAVVAYRKDKSPDSGATMEQLNWQAALIIGIVQCASMWPGTSRALVAILGGLLVGLSLKAAVEFSFLLGVITLLAAAGYDAMKHGTLIFSEYGVWTPILGCVVAAISAAVAVKWMVHYLERYSLAIFGYYRIVLGLLIAALLWYGLL